MKFIVYILISFFCFNETFTNSAKAEALGLSIGTPTSVIYSLDINSGDNVDVALRIRDGLGSYVAYRNNNKKKLDWYWSAGMTISQWTIYPRGAVGVSADLAKSPISIFGEISLEVTRYLNWIGGSIGIRYPISLM